MLTGLVVTLAVREVKMLLENMQSSLHLCRRSAVRKQVNSRERCSRVTRGSVSQPLLTFRCVDVLKTLSCLVKSSFYPEIPTDPLITLCKSFICKLKSSSGRYRRLIPVV